MTKTVCLKAIRAAAERIQGIVHRTPLIDVSEKAQCQLMLKCENLQVAGAFKIRGAYNTIVQMTQECPGRGVVTYSSGNHAQAVAFAARHLQIPAVVVMPETAPLVKVDGARSYGAEVIFEGVTSIARRERAEAEAMIRDFTIIPPFDHPEIISGQGTVGLEILEDCDYVSTIYVPIGGGGLISGVGAAVKQIHPSVRIVGVEPEGGAAMVASIAAGKPVTLERVRSVADGLLPVRPGDLTFAHVTEFVDDVITVKDEEIIEAVQWLMTIAKLVVEPSGAATVAAALFRPGARKLSQQGATVAVLSGGNIADELLVSLFSGLPRVNPEK
tara:strand:- start:3658 stop:4644 length:987 start_codon:yes stop_codon:yes gene_type:complete